jgi:hypothetical protein
MRKLVRTIIILTVIWGAWWFAASTGLERSVAAWLEDRRGAGWHADVAKISKQGFPLKLHTRLQDVYVSDPTSGIAIDMLQLDLIAAAYWPGFMKVQLPDTPINIAIPNRTLTLNAIDGIAELRLRPGPSLQLQNMRFTSDAWAVEEVEGNLISAKDLRLSAVQNETSAKLYHLALNAADLKPGLNIRAAFKLPIDWPLTFETFTADMDVGFDKAWDRSALDGTRPQPRSIVVRSISAVWGTLNVMGTGNVTLDPAGIPTGMMTVNISNWRDILDLVETSGALAASQRVQAEFMAGALSNQGDDPNDLTLVLSFKNGQMSLGPINLGPAPRLVFQ